MPHPLQWLLVEGSDRGVGVATQIIDGQPEPVVPFAWARQQPRLRPDVGVEPVTLRCSIVAGPIRTVRVVGIEQVQQGEPVGSKQLSG